MTVGLRTKFADSLPTGSAGTPSFEHASGL